MSSRRMRRSRSMPIRILPLALLLLAGCFTTPKQKVPFAGYTHYPLLPPASFGRVAEFEHILQGEYQGRTFQLHALLRMDSTELLVLGLTPFGTRAFTIRYDGREVELDNPNGPKLAFPPELIISDIQEMFWPWLPDQNGWRVSTVEPAKGRDFFFANQRISSVRFTRGKDGQRVIELANLKYGYHLRLQIIEDDEPK